MRFVVTNRQNGERFSVTEECVIRVIGMSKLKRLVNEANDSGVSFTYHFEGTYDIKAERGGN